jgi:hypothetical protein
MQNNQEKIITALRRANRPVLLDEIISTTRLSAADATAALTMLEISGQLRKNPDGHYVLPSSNPQPKRAPKTPKAGKKPPQSKPVGNIIKVRVCSSRYRDTGNGRFVQAPTTTPTKVQVLRKPQAAARRSDLGKNKWEDGNARARYTLENKNGRTVARVRYFTDLEARAALRAAKDPEEKKAIRKYNTDARRELQKELQREYDTDFLDKELYADVRRSIAARAVRTRAENKAAGKKPKNQPTAAEAQAAVVKLKRQIPDLNARFNRARTEKTKRESKKRRDNAQKFLVHWRLVVAGKRSTYPKGWRK